MPNSTPNGKIHAWFMRGCLILFVFALFKAVAYADLTPPPPTTKQVFVKTDAASTLTASTTSKQFFTVSPGPTIPANTLRVGQVIVVYGAMYYSTSAVVTPTVVPEIDFNSTPVIASAPIANILNASNKPATFSATMVVNSIGSTGAVTSSGIITFYSAAGAVLMTLVVPTAPVTIDTTVDISILPALTYSSVTAGNSITLTQYSGFVYDRL